MSARKSAALALVAALVGGIAVAFGGREYWATAWLRFGTLAAFALLSWSERPSRWIRKDEWTLIAPIALLIGLAFLQAMPMPGALVRRIDPRTADLHARAVPPGGGGPLPQWLATGPPEPGFALDAGSRIDPGPADSGGAASSSVSINPVATRTAALDWGTFVLLFLVARRLSLNPLIRYRLLWSIAAWGGLLSVLAVVQKVTGSPRLLWLRDAPPSTDPIGPFVNPNHFAGWIEMVLLVSTGLLLAHLAEPDGRLSLSRFRAAIADRAWTLPRVIVLSAASVFAAGAFMLAGSRAGFLSLGIGFLALLPLGRLRAWIPAAVVAAMIIGLAVGLAAWVGREERGLKTAIFAEVSRDPSLAMRSDIWGRTLRIVKDHPWTGTGLATFRWAYSGYEREGEWQRTTQAHNDFLQLASETGLVGVALLVWAMVILAVRVVAAAVRPSDRAIGRWSTIGCAAALLAMLVHSVFDFGLQVPAVAVLFAIVAGILAAAAVDGAPADEATP